MYVTISVVLEEVNKTNLYVYVIRLCLKYRNLPSSSSSPLLVVVSEELQVSEKCEERLLLLKLF